jgi:hypothetical protein
MRGSAPALFVQVQPKPRTSVSFICTLDGGPRVGYRSSLALAQGDCVCVCVRELCVELCVRSFVPPAHTDTGAARRPFFPKTRLFVSLKCMCIVRIAAPLFLYRSICVLCWPRLAESVLFVLRSAPHWRRLREARAVLCFVHAHACTGVFMQAPGAVVAPATPLHTVPTRP